MASLDSLLADHEMPGLGRVLPVPSCHNAGTIRLSESTDTESSLFCPALLFSHPKLPDSPPPNCRCPIPDYCQGRSRLWSTSSGASQSHHLEPAGGTPLRRTISERCQRAAHHNQHRRRPFRFRFRFCLEVEAVARGQQLELFGELTPASQPARVAR